MFHQRMTLFLEISYRLLLKCVSPASAMAAMLAHWGLFGVEAGEEFFD